MLSILFPYCQFVLLKLLFLTLRNSDLVVTKNFMFVMLEVTRNWESMVGCFIFYTKNSPLRPESEVTARARIVSLTFRPGPGAWRCLARGSQHWLSHAAQLLTVNKWKKLHNDITRQQISISHVRPLQRVTGPTLHCLYMGSAAHLSCQNM